MPFLLFILAVSLSLSGCTTRWTFLGQRDSEIKNATQDIATARDDAGRAKAYSARGAAYSEKARYSRVFKLIADSEYTRLFDLAIQDHDRAVTLNPASSQVFMNRGRTYYDRGWLDLMDHRDGKPWFGLAATDFQKAVDKGPTNSDVVDLLGIAHEGNDDWDDAFAAYTREMALNRKLGRMRLADAHCNRGQHFQQNADAPAAALEYRKSIDVGATPDDGCSCEPFNSLVAIHTENRDYGQAWEVVRIAQSSKHQIYSEILDRLKKDSGRSQ